MEELKPYLTRNLICSIVLLFIIFLSLSSGDGMGGMVVMIGSIALAVTTFIVTTFISILAINIFKERHHIIQKIIFGGYICLILFTIYVILYNI